MSETLIHVEHLSKKFCRDLRQSLWYGARDLGSALIGRRYGHDSLRPNEFWAVEDVGFELRRGECIGLIGPNGAGKTTLLRMLNGLIKPDRGRIEIRGRVGALIALGAGFNPILTGRENIYVNAAVLGFSKRETDARFDEIVSFSGLQDFIDSPVQHYSSGMYMRLGFAVAAHLEPDVLLVDEALAVGDVAYVIKCLNRIAELRQNGTGVIFVTHNELQLREAAANCLLMHYGRIEAAGRVEDIWPKYGRLRAADPGSRLDEGFVHDGPIRIDSLSMNESSTTGFATSGGALHLNVRCMLSTPVIAVSLDLRFWNAAGQVATSVQSGSYGYFLDIPSGPAEISVEVPYLPLLPGQYRIAGGFRRDGEFLGWSRDLGTLEVQAPSNMHISEGLCAAVATFALKNTPVEAHNE